MLAATIYVEQIDEVLPIAIQRLQVCRDLFAGGELFVIRIDLVLHPAQILDSFTLARIEPFDNGFALRVAQLAGALLLSALYQTAIEWGGRNHSEIHGFSY